ncbi:hypothetical protein GGI07_000550 [Coemansia sp. Benny D115]|nr:hypothetical protein GGI07_000550 [Coemansia sp. Benny D115]
MSSTPVASAAGTAGSSSNSSIIAAHSAKRQRADQRTNWRHAADIQPLRKYTPTPTPGTARLHSTQPDYGYADFYPAKARCAEMQMNERTIRHGYIDTAVVDNEYQSSHDLVYERLRDSRVVQELQAFAAAAAQRQRARGGMAAGAMNAFPALPNRSVRSDEQRDEWLQNLANPRVPLAVLVSGTPFGLRADRLLDALCTHRVPLQRAIWAVRLVGVYEMFGMQTKAPDHSSLRALERTYTAQWSKQFTQHIERLLASAPTKAASDPPSTAETIAAWSRNWEYSLTLLHTQYSHGLLDQRHMVSWLVGQLRQLPVDRCMLLLPLLTDYTAEIGKSRNPLRKLIAAVVHRIEHAARYPSLHNFRAQLSSYLVSLFLAYADAFVEPTTWPLYRADLEDASRLLQDKSAELEKALRHVDQRNREFACLANDCEFASKASVSKDPAPLEPLAVLATFGPDSDVSQTFSRLFSSSATGSSPMHLVRIICYWAVEDQVPEHATRLRTLAAARLCALTLHTDPATEHEKQVVSQTALQRAVVGFLDIFRLPPPHMRAQRSAAARRVCLLLERLADTGCFSVTQYLQLLIARGDMYGDNALRERSQCHLEYATNLPCTTEDAVEQRRMLLYDCGVVGLCAGSTASHSKAVVDEMLDCLRTQISAMLPFLIAYACATPLRAKENGKQSTIDVDTVRWWLPAPASGERSQVDVLDLHSLPTPASFVPATASRLVSSAAHVVCSKDWISPLVDSLSDASALSQDLAGQALRLLQTGPRIAVGYLVEQRLMPLVYDYVVKDVKVGVDNWRVITQPGTSLLNRRQAAAIIRLLMAAELHSQLLRFLLWTLGHTRVTQVTALAHRTLRRLTRVWALLGKLPGAIEELQASYDNSSAYGGSDSFDFELYRTARHWSRAEPQLGAALLERLHQDYVRFVGLQAQTLIQGSGHAPAQALASKELMQLAHQLVRDRMHDTGAPASDDSEWAILPCFQKLARWAQHATQKAEHAVGYATAQSEQVPGAAPSGVTHAQQARLQAMLSHVIADAIQAALQTSRTQSTQSFQGASLDRAGDEALVHCFVELCAHYIKWFAVRSGLMLSPEMLGPILLKAMATGISEWTLSRQSVSTGTLAASVQYSQAEVELASRVARIWVASLVICGCLRIQDLIPWLIEKCREPVTQANAPQFMYLAGAICALGMPTSQLVTDQSTGQQPQQQGRQRRSSENSSAENGLADPRHVYELLEIGSSWEAALYCNKISRIQAIELVFTGALASGNLRDAGAPQLAAILMRSTAALAQSPWIQAIVDYIPSSEQPQADNSASADPVAVQPERYYSLLEIYRANIEGQISDPLVALPVKRAILRALMTLCDGIDPETEGFSAMTTAEVAHRLRKTTWRFWHGPASKGGGTAAVSKLAIILNSLLLFASAALQESEASTDAFAIAAGAEGISDMQHQGVESLSDANGVGGQDITGCVSPCLSQNNQQVQFVTNATAYLCSCVQEAVLHWDLDSSNPSGLLDRKCAGLTEALCTLNQDVLSKLVETCSSTLFMLNMGQLRAVADAVAKSGNLTQQQQQQQQQQQKAQLVDTNLADKRVLAIIDANRVSVPKMLALSFATDSCLSDMMDDVEPGVDSTAVATTPSAKFLMMRGSALAALIQRLVAKLANDTCNNSSCGNSTGSSNANVNKTISGTNTPHPFASAGDILANLRDFASGMLGQLQAIATHANPAAAQSLCLRVSSFSAASSNTSSPSVPQGVGFEIKNNLLLPQNVSEESAADRLRTVTYWRLQAIQPLCGLMRAYPDEFGVGEWLMTLVTLCLSPVYQQHASASMTHGSASLYQFLLDFAAITNESITATMRKHALVLLRSVVPLLRSSTTIDAQSASILGRLFPFDMTSTLTRDLQPSSLFSATAPNVGGLDNPWTWIESLEFVALDQIKSTTIFNSGLEGMTPFTLRGMLEQENAARRDKISGSTGVGMSGAGYLANVKTTGPLLSSGKAI